MILKKSSLLFIVALLTFNVLSAQQWGNYTLYGIMNGTTTYMIDTNSNNFHTWTHTTSNRTGYSSYLLPGGTLVRSVSRAGNSFNGGPICGQVQKVDWAGNILWDYVYSTQQYCSHHDICPMPNGNVLLIAYERKTPTEVSAAGCTGSFEMWPDKIVEIEPVGATGGNVVWEWHAWDHLVQNVDSLKANYKNSIVDHPELLNINYQAQKDWMHMNGVSYNPMLDQVAFSCHNLDEIYVIDHSTTTAEAASHSGGNSGMGGDLLYRWGNPSAYSAAGSSVLNVVHDAHWIPEGSPNAGYMVGYNNNGISNQASCVDIVSPPYNGYNYSITPGSAYLPSNYTLRQPSGGYNSNMGNSQQLPNGNMLLCIATSGIIKEFDAAGNLLWFKTATGSVPKAFRYDSCYVFNPAPAIPTITFTSGDLISTTASTYQWYLNGSLIAGATNQNYTPTQYGMYLVRITDANGCVYRYSQGFNYSASTGFAQVVHADAFSVYPNPCSSLVHFDHAISREKDYEVILSDISGKNLQKFNNSNTLDLSRYQNGVYLITLKSKTSGEVTTRVTLIK